MHVSPPETLQGNRFRESRPVLFRCQEYLAATVRFVRDEIAHPPHSVLPKRSWCRFALEGVLLCTWKARSFPGKVILKPSQPDTIHMYELFDNGLPSRAAGDRFETRCRYFVDQEQIDFVLDAPRVENLLDDSLVGRSFSDVDRKRWYALVSKRILDSVSWAAGRPGLKCVLLQGMRSRSVRESAPARELE